MQPSSQCNRCSAPLPLDARFCSRCGASQPNTMADPLSSTELDPDAPGHRLGVPPRILRPGTRLSDIYTIDGLLGEGGMGIVYRATDHARERAVAIKLLHVNLMGDAGIRRRFAREARLMATWNHPYVVSAYDFVESDDAVALVMEYVDGPTLEQHMQRWGKPLPYDEVRMVFDGVLDAMAHAHALGIVHRDLKPQNILLRTDSRRLHPKIVDFGIAKVLEGTTYTVTGVLLGTTQYMSPEQVEEPDTIDHRSDIYSLGVCLYRAVTGRVPFSSDSHFALLQAHVTQPPPPPSAIRADLPAALEALILEALAKSRDARPPSCQEFRERLARALAPVIPARSGGARDALPPTVREPDGTELVLIPAGTFQMGVARREVFLSDYYLARHPVTNRQFQAFVDITGYWPDDEEARRFLSHWRGRACPVAIADHPVVFVSWYDARAYCTWAGRRLPTEAEWEKAARGTDGRKFPWGRSEPTASHANFGRTGGTVAVGTCPDGVSPYGVEDLAGNVGEWCEDIDDPRFYTSGPDRNPRNTIQTGDRPCVVRGGGWMYDARSLRTYARTSLAPTFRLDGVGFRCAT